MGKGSSGRRTSRRRTIDVISNKIYSKDLDTIGERPLERRYLSRD